jgi:ADP-ribosylglycohydrolase
MRLATVPMFYAAYPGVAIEKSGESSLTTHGAAAAVDACRYFGGLLAGALSGDSKEELLSELYSPLPGYWQERRLHPEIHQIAAGSFKRKQPPEIEGSGYVVRSLEAALWAFYKSGSFREGCLEAVNLGQDADTTGAIYGQLGGAFYGAQSIPEGWRSKLALREKIEGFASQLYELAKRPLGVER